MNASAKDWERVCQVLAGVGFPMLAARIRMGLEGKMSEQNVYVMLSLEEGELIKQAVKELKGQWLDKKPRGWPE